MKTDHLLSILVLFAALLLVGCGAKPAAASAVPEEAQAGKLAGLEACEFQPAGSKMKYAAQCGTLVVPENWGVTRSRLIALPVVRIPASRPNPAEPVFYLQGGPGGPNLVWSPPAWLLDKHDVVMVGYRGAEGSVVLSCPAVNRLLKAHIGKDLFSDPARQEYVVAVKQCATTHQAAGVDLSSYTIPGVIEDMEAARIELGYARINLFSESYGTRIAQIYAYMHPESLHRLVLVGVNTPGHFVWDRAVFDKMIGYLSELCAQAVACNRRTSDFAQTMYAVNHNMPQRWLFFNIDPDTTRMVTHMMFFSNSSMPMIIDAYLAAAEGDASGLAMMNLLGALMMPEDRPIIGDSLNKGGTVDLEKYGGIESISLGDSIMGAPWSEFSWPLAAEWPLELIPKELREFQESDVEMLLVNGTVDFSTPPTALDEAKPYYHKAQMILLPEFSHTDDVFTLQTEAFERMITSFYATGLAYDSGYVYQPLGFKPPMSLTLVAKLLVAAMVIFPALGISGVAMVVHRMRKRSRSHKE